MRRHAAYTLNLLGVTILALLGQGLALIPDRFPALTGVLPGQALPWAGIGLVVLDLICANAVLTNVPDRLLRLVNLLVALTFGGLTWLYFRANLPIPAAMMATISLGHLLLLESRGGRPLLPDPLGLVLAISSLAAAVTILLAQPPVSRETLPDMAWPLVLVCGFLFKTAFGVYATIRGSQPKARWLLLAGILPWLGWPILMSNARVLDVLIPVMALVLSLVFGNRIRWEHIILPANNLLGQRFTAAMSSIALLTLGGLCVLSILSLPPAPDLAFVFSLSISALLTLITVVVNLTISRLLSTLSVSEPNGENGAASSPTASGHVSAMVARLLEPFSASRQELLTQVQSQEERLRALLGELHTERRRVNQLQVLGELDGQLENRLDPPVAAQLVANAMLRALHCDLVAVLMHEPEHNEFVALAAASRLSAAVPPGYRQNDRQGLIGRAARSRKTQLVNDTRLDPDHINAGAHLWLSEVVVPLIRHGRLQGVLVADDKRPHAFSPSDVQTLETAATVLMRGWERANYAQRLTELIQAGITLSTASDPHAAINEIAEIARHTLQANFTFVTLPDRDSNRTRAASSGYAPSLVRWLGQYQAQDSLLQTVLNADHPLRVRDIRKYSPAAHLRVDHEGLRSLLAIPIRLRRMTIGAILAFGKQGEIAFTESDESLASLLASQAGAAIESAWLVEQLRSTLKTTTLLHELSTAILQAEAPEEAARAIAEKAAAWTGAEHTGIVLFTADKKIEAEVALGPEGERDDTPPPLETIEQTLAAGQSLFLSQGSGQTRICCPLQTPRRQYGALWLDMFEEDSSNSRFATNLLTLCNQSAIALERAILLGETRRQAAALEAAFHELEVTYDRTLAALTSALDARDRETEGHSVRVSRLTCMLGKALGLNPGQLKMLERGSLLHDIGKIGISDTILHKPGPLSEEEWKIMRLHPEIGARIVEDIPFLRDTLTVIRYHQERWDGSGYPEGLRGEAIPLPARIFAVADAFDALTSTRPYRDKISMREALDYLRRNAGVLFDPQIVATLEKLSEQGELEAWLSLE